MAVGTLKSLLVKLAVDSADLEKGLTKAEQSATKTRKVFDGLARQLATVAGPAAMGALIVSSVKLAARVETLKVVVGHMGKTAGYVEGELEGFRKAIESQGITTQNTLQSMSQMIQANIDLAEGAGLARIAQNNAVIANINSSEAFKRLVTVLQTGNILMGRTMGLTLDFGGAQERLAKELGKTTQELTQAEIVQSRLNEVKRAGVAIEGVYEAAMGTTGKTMLSLDRQLEEIRLAVGEVFLPVLSEAVQLIYDAAASINELIKTQKELSIQEKVLAKDIITTGGSYEDLRKQLKPLAEAQGKYLYTNKELEEGLWKLWESFPMMIEGYRGMSEEMFDAMVVTAEYEERQARLTKSIEEGIEPYRAYLLETAETAASMEGLGKATKDVTGETKTAKDAVSDFWSVLREGPGIMSALESDMEAIDYSQAGAQAITEAREGIETALAEGLITEAEADRWFGQLYVAANQIEVELGNITAYQAALNIRKNVGGPLSEARGRVDDIDSTLKFLASKEWEITVFLRYMGVPLDRRQFGGSVAAHHPYLVGEREPEMFVPSVSGRIEPIDGRTTVGGPTIEEVNINIGGDGRVLETQMAMENSLFRVLEGIL